MKKLMVFFGLCVLLCFGLAQGQAPYLIRIDQVDRAAVDQIRRTEVVIYAKTPDFWLGVAKEGDLESLTRSGISFELLDQASPLDEYYLIMPKPQVRIEARLAEIAAKSRILSRDENMVLVKGHPQRIEELAFSGFSLRKVQKRPLPLEPATLIGSYIQSLSPGYDPLIDTITSRVDQGQLLEWIDDLTGEDTATIGGRVDSIKTRYSYGDDLTKAANYLKERFEGMGLPVQFDTLRVQNPGGFFWDVACSPGGDKAWSVGSWTGIMRTTDGGNLWSVVEGSDSLSLYDICRLDDDTLWAAGDDHVIRSTDGGDTWESRIGTEYQGLGFRGCHFEDARSGWVVGWEKILFTEDGGQTWIEQAHVPWVSLQGIDFADPNNGWVVGLKETILHTSNRGISWSLQHSSSSAAQLADVDFVDSLRGWAVGTGGKAFRTTDGGANWISRDFPPSSFLLAIDFVDSLRGRIAGADGMILYTSDFGENWIPQGSFANHLYGVDFADTLIGWICGNDLIIRTADGGDNWSVTYQACALDLFNLVATIRGTRHPGREVLLTAHYDAMSDDPYNLAPGADDNASGTVSLLAAASILKDYHFTNTLKLVAFTGEELGLLGSAKYAEDAYNRGDTLLGVLNFDMIAYDGNGDDTMEVHCGFPEENQALGDLLIGAISQYGLSLAPQKLIQDASHSSDHASFWDWDFPAISGGEDHQDFNPYYHSTDDRVSAFDTAYYVDFTRAAVAGIAILGDPFIPGDVNEDRIVNIGDVVFLISYLYRAGPAPDPVAAGDVNCDGIVDLGDVVYLISYLYRGGDPPAC